MKNKSKQAVVQRKEIPKGAVRAKYYKQNSDYPVQFYEAINFKRTGCGINSIWTANNKRRIFKSKEGTSTILQSGVFLAIENVWEKGINNGRK